MSDQTTNEEEGGQKNQRNAGDVDSNIDLGLGSIIDNFSNEGFRSYGVVMIRTILAKIVSKRTRESVKRSTYEEKLLFEVERHDVVTIR